MRWRRPLAATVLAGLAGVATVVCHGQKHSVTSNAAPTGTLAVDYSASGGQPHVETHLRLAAGGTAELSLASSYGVPGVHPPRVGTFAAPASSALYAELERYVAKHKLLEKLKGSPMETPHTVVRAIHLTVGARTAKASVGTKTSKEVEGLEALLARIMQGLLAHPRRAVELSVTGDPHPTSASHVTIAPVIEVRNVGEEPVAVWLSSASVALEERAPLPSGDGMWLPVFNEKREGMAVRASAEQLEAARQAPVVQNGALARGAVLRVPVDTITAPSGALARRLKATIQFRASEAAAASYFEVDATAVLPPVQRQAP